MELGNDLIKKAYYVLSLYCLQAISISLFNLDQVHSVGSSKWLEPKRGGHRPPLIFLISCYTDCNAYAPCIRSDCLINAGQWHFSSNIFCIQCLRTISTGCLSGLAERRKRCLIVIRDKPGICCQLVLLSYYCQCGEMVTVALGYPPIHEHSSHSKIVMSEGDPPPPPPQEHVITARRSGDGFLTFDLKISHIIEQTLLRALNRPNFRKSTIKVMDDEVDAGECSSQSNAESSKSPAALPAPQDTESNNRSLTTIQKKRKSDDNGLHSSNDSDSCDSTTREIEYLLKRPCRELVSTEDSVINTKAISSIPASWLSRGISLEERRQFQQSIDNASLCPYERKRNNNNVAKAEDDILFLPHVAGYDEEYAADPFSPTSATANDPISPVASVSTLYIPQPTVSNPSTTCADYTQPTRTLSQEVFDVDQQNELFVDTVSHSQLGDSPYRPPSLEDFETQQYFQADAYS